MYVCNRGKIKRKNYEKKNFMKNIFNKSKKAEYE
jgi:hypothetical protein